MFTGTSLFKTQTKCYRHNGNTQWMWGTERYASFKYTQWNLSDLTFLKCYTLETGNYEEAKTEKIWLKDITGYTVGAYFVSLS